MHVTFLENKRATRGKLVMLGFILIMFSECLTPLSSSEEFKIETVGYVRHVTILNPIALYGLFIYEIIAAMKHEFVEKDKKGIF
jgi:hypothetical protein